MWCLDENIVIDEFVNGIFEENKFFYELFFYSNFTILNYDSEISNIPFNHEKVIKLKSNVYPILDVETLTGIVDFLYIDFNIIEKYVDEIPNNWSLFIINPILMKYNQSGTIGLFLTPKYEDNFIEECNNFIKLHTGYSLFLKYSIDLNIPKILFEKADLSLKNFVEEMKKTSNKGLDKLLDFWANNDCVSVSSFEYRFEDYKNKLFYTYMEDINLKDIISTVPFEIIHEVTGEKLGVLKQFNLDKVFNLAYVDYGVLKLSNCQINDLIDGKYDFKLVG